MTRRFDVARVAQIVANVAVATVACALTLGGALAAIVS